MAQADPAADKNRRRDDRLPVDWHCKLILPDDETEYACQVIDVSLAGTQVKLIDAPDLRRDQELILDIAELGQFAAKIAWLKPGSAGLTLLAGPDLLLKRFAEASGGYPSRQPADPD